MLDKLAELEYKTMSSDDANTLLNELVELPDTELNDAVIKIIDNMPFDDGDDKLPPSYTIIFSNDKIKKIVGDLIGDDK